MPLEVLAEITTTVLSDEPPRTIDAYVSDPSDDRTIDAVVLSTYVDAFNGSTTFHGYRVTIAGEDVTRDLVGAVEHRRDGYSGEEEVKFTLRGARWSVFRTLRTSTLLAPVVLEVQHGATPVDMVADPPVLLRIVQAEHRSEEEHHLLVDIVALDELSARSATTELCFEVAPRSGRTVGSIVNSIFAGVPIPSAVPDGRVFQGRMQETGTRLLDRVAELMETEGWFRRTTNGTVTVGTMDPRPPEEPPDWELNPRGWNSDSALDVAAPTEVPFRYVVRGETSTKAGDGGIETIREVVEERGLFAPEYALKKQVGGLDNPATVPVAVTPPTASDRLVSRFERERQIRNGLPEIETVKEFGWDWTLRALAIFQASGNKLTYYAGIYIDGDGNGRTTASQRFKLLRTTVTRWTYGPSGEQMRRVVTVYEDVLRDKPCLAPNNPGSVVVDAYLYGDGRSYADARALEGRKAEEITYLIRYGARNRVESEETTRFAYYLRAGRDDGAPGSTSPAVLLNADGNGQVYSTAFFQRTHHSQTRYFTTNSGQRTGSVVDNFGWRVRPNQKGIYTVNGVNTNDAVELYGKLAQKRESETLRRITRTQTEATTWLPGQLPQTVTYLAPLPITPGVPSSWTSTRIQPLSYFEEDGNLIAAYGAHVRVIQSDFADTQEVLQRLARHARRRDSSVEVAVDRRLSPIQPGDTVDIWSPKDGMEAPRRTLCIEKFRRMSPYGFSESLTFESARFAP